MDRKFRMVYELVEDGDTIVVPKNGEYYMCCCDCNLVHAFKFTVNEKGRIAFIVHRDNRKTAALRRHHPIKKVRRGTTA